MNVAMVSIRDLNKVATRQFRNQIDRFWFTLILVLASEVESQNIDTFLSSRSLG